MSEYIACIPARGGSKGIPKKNIANLGGKPLIAHSLEAAVSSKMLDRVYVTTDCDEIAEVACKYIDPSNIIMRPPELASDSASTYSAVEHLLENIHCDSSDNLVLLQPTSPMRTVVHIDDAIAKFDSENFANSLIGVTVEQHHPFKSFRMDGLYLKPFQGAENLSLPRQKLPPIYRQNGALYISNVGKLKKFQSFFIEPCMPFIMEARASIDIDEFLDIKFAEFLLKE